MSIRTTAGAHGCWISGAAVHQAEGALASRLVVSIEDAAQVLRDHVVRTGLALEEVAEIALYHGTALLDRG